MRLATIFLCIIIFCFVWFLQDQTGLPGHFYGLALNRQTALSEAAKTETGSSVMVPAGNGPPSDQAGGGQQFRGRVWVQLGPEGQQYWALVTIE